MPFYSPNFWSFSPRPVSSEAAFWKLSRAPFHILTREKQPKRRLKGQQASKWKKKIFIATAFRRNAETSNVYRTQLLLSHRPRTQAFFDRSNICLLAIFEKNGCIEEIFPSGRENHLSDCADSEKLWKGRRRTKTGGGRKGDCCNIFRACIMSRNLAY